MNIFVIPSWYPSKRNKVNGIFFYEQAIAFAELRPSWNLCISLWGQSEYSLSLQQIRQWPEIISDFFHNSRPSVHKLKENVIEYLQPTITWHPRLWDGNLAGVTRATGANYKQACRDFGPFDLILAQVSYPAGWAAMKLSEETGIPYIISEHMGPFVPPVFIDNGTLKPLIKEPLDKANERVAVSPFLAEQMAAAGAAPKPLNIPWMVDERFFNPGEVRRQHGKTVFFTLAAMIEAKGIRDLLMAIKKLTDNLPANMRESVSFRLGGGGRQLREFQCLSSEMGLDGYVTWLGPLAREQVRDELRSCNYFVLPSRFDTFSVVCAEALACGRPVLATRCGGPNSIVTDGLGLLSDVGDIDGLADNMRKVVTGEIVFSPEGIRNNFMSRFSREVVVQKWEQIFAALKD